MQCVEELSPEALFDLDEIEALPSFDVPDFMPDVPAIAFTFTEAGTSSATACTYSATVVSENPYDGVFCFAQSPLGLLTVHIWNYEGGSGGGAWGHASITLDNGTHISWWPQGTGREPSSFSGRIYAVAANSGQTFDEDKRLEGLPGIVPKQPDKNITITGLDEAAIQSWWDTFSGDSNNKWKTLSKNCSTTAADALKAGGADVRWRDVFKGHNMVWTPADVEEFANAINRHLDDKPKKTTCP
jgi:hypothetical protein